jgi:hypothetical protein
MRQNHIIIAIRQSALLRGDIFLAVRQDFCRVQPRKYRRAPFQDIFITLHLYLTLNVFPITSPKGIVVNSTRAIFF